MKHAKFIKNESGLIILAVVMSMLLMIAAVAVFSVVSGRFGITYNMNNRIQALRYNEAASYVAYQFIREGLWYSPAEEEDWAKATPVPAASGFPGPHTVKIDTDHKEVTITVASDGTDKISAKVSY